jgi:hypothetical protein
MTNHSILDGPISAGAVDRATSHPRRQVVRLNRRLGRVTLDGEEYGRWSGQPWLAEEAARDLVAATHDTYGAPVVRYCPDL